MIRFTFRLNADNQRYTLIDTAGIRRKGRVDDTVEKFSVVKALDAMVNADVALLVIDATEGVVEQDLHIVSYAVEAGTGLILVVNKVDAMNAEQRRILRKSLSRRLTFAEWIPIPIHVRTPTDWHQETLQPCAPSSRLRAIGHRDLRT